MKHLQGRLNSFFFDRIAKVVAPLYIWQQKRQTWSSSVSFWSCPTASLLLTQRYGDFFHDADREREARAPTFPLMECVCGPQAYNGNTALHVAASLQYRVSQLDAVRLLMRKGADPSARNLENEQPVHLVPDGLVGEQVQNS